MVFFNMSLEEERVKLEKIFSNLPEKIRKEDIIVVIEDRPYTWNAAYLEVKNKSELGEKILKKLKDMGII
jgi:predicted glycosyltransferase